MGRGMLKGILEQFQSPQDKKSGGSKDPIGLVLMALATREAKSGQGEQVAMVPLSKCERCGCPQLWQDIYQRAWHCAACDPPPSATFVREVRVASSEEREEKRIGVDDGEFFQTVTWKEKDGRVVTAIKGVGEKVGPARGVRWRDWWERGLWLADRPSAAASETQDHQHHKRDAAPAAIPATLGSDRPATSEARATTPENRDCPVSESSDSALKTPRKTRAKRSTAADNSRSLWSMTDT